MDPPPQKKRYGNPGTGAAPVKVASPPPPAMYKSGSKMPTSNVDSNLFGTMTIPTTFISGSCVDNPVRMLEDTTTTCTRVRAEIKNDCAAFGKFDAKLYMYATNFLLQKVGDRSTQPDELLDMPRWFSWTRTSTGETKRLNGVHFEDVASSAAKGDSGGDSNGGGGGGGGGGTDGSADDDYGGGGAGRAEDGAGYADDDDLVDDGYGAYGKESIGSGDDSATLENTTTATATTTTTTATTISGLRI